MVKKYVDKIILVSEEEIKEAMSYVFKEEHFVLEGAAVVGIAALLSKKIKTIGGNSVIVTTGSNVGNNLFLNTLDIK